MKTQIYSSILTLTGVALSANVAYAQTYQPSNRIPVADNTLGTQVSGSSNNFNVTGGLSRGQNLFHSFQDFSVPTNGSVTFTNPAGNQSIITRVTGNQFSDINGKVDTNGANFFLINPNGIVFGNNVQLNVGKSFVSSTANGIDLVDPQGKVYTFGAKNINDIPLLTVNPNVFLNVSRLNMGASNPTDVGIKNYGTLQTNNDNQYIGLIGGNVTLDGSSGSGDIFARGGRVDLGGLNTAGMISLDKQGLVFYGDSLIMSDVSLINGSHISVETNKSIGIVNTLFNNTSSSGSNVNINANDVKLSNDLARINNKPSIKTSDGDININATGQLSLDSAKISTYNTLQDLGASGKINVSAQGISINNEGSLGGRNIDIKTTGKLSLDNSVIGAYNTPDNLNSGNINILAQEININNRGLISARNIDIKTTGDIILFGDDIKGYNRLGGVPDTRSSIESYGSSGRISIETKGILSLDDSKISTESYQSNSQDINILARELKVTNGSRISSDTELGGNAGNINIKTTGDITISYFEDSLYPNYLNFLKDLKSDYDFIGSYNGDGMISMSSQSMGGGDSGKISLNTPGKISIINGGIISSDISYFNDTGTGNSQGIQISAKQLDLNNSGYISSSISSNGKGGDINIKATDAINLNNYSSILAGTKLLGNSNGESGNIVIDTKQINIKNSELATVSLGLSGGNIMMTVSDRLLMQQYSGILASSQSTQKTGNGGNITINSPLIIATP